MPDNAEFAMMAESDGTGAEGVSVLRGVSVGRGGVVVVYLSS
jgi:hypothetical protein